MFSFRNGLYLRSDVFTRVLHSGRDDDRQCNAVRDQLTGLLNRRGMAEQGAMAFASSRRHESSQLMLLQDGTVKPLAV